MSFPCSNCFPLPRISSVTPDFSWKLVVLFFPLVMIISLPFFLRSLFFNAAVASCFPSIVNFFFVFSPLLVPEKSRLRAWTWLGTQLFPVFFRLFRLVSFFSERGRKIRAFFSRRAAGMASPFAAVTEFLCMDRSYCVASSMGCSLRLLPSSCPACWFSVFPQVDWCCVPFSALGADILLVLT